MLEFKKSVWGINFIGPRGVNQENDFEIGIAVQDGVEVPAFRMGGEIFTVEKLLNGGSGGTQFPASGIQIGDTTLSEDTLKQMYENTCGDIRTI